MKVFLLLVMIWPVQLIFAADEGYTIVEKDSKKGLVNEKGDLIIPTQYDDLGWTQSNILVIDDVLGYRRGNFWGLLNLKNEKISEAVYTSLQPFNQKYIIAGRLGKFSNHNYFGVIKTNGQTSIPFKYYTLKSCGDLLIASLDNDNRHLYHGLIDKKDKILIPFEYCELEMLTNALFIAKDCEEAVYLIDEKGNKMNEEPLSGVSLVEDGLMVIDQNGKKGLVDQSGNLLLKPIFKEIRISEEGVKALPFPKWEVYDQDFNKIFAYNYDEIKPLGQNRYLAKSENHQAIVNSENKLVSAFENINIHDFKDTLAIFSKDGKSGLISINGKPLLKAEFSEIDFQGNFIFLAREISGSKQWMVMNNHLDTIANSGFKDVKFLNSDVIGVFDGDYWGMIDQNGNQIATFKYDSLKSLSKKSIKVTLLGQQGIMDMNGDWVVTPVKGKLNFVNDNTYLASHHYCENAIFIDGKEVFCTKNDLLPYDGGFLEVTEEGKVGYVDIHGQQQLYPVYDSLSRSMEGYFVYIKEGKYGIMDQKGSVLTRMSENDYQLLFPANEEFFGAKIDDKYGFVDAVGHLRIANRYEGIGRFHNGFSPVKLLGRWGFIDKREKLAIQPRYEAVGEFENNVCWVSNGNKYGLVNSEDELVLDFEYDTLIRNEHNRFYSTRDGKLGLVGVTGRELLYTKFDELDDLGNGFVIAKRRGEYGLLTNDGVNRIPLDYDQLIYDSYNNLYLAKKNQEWETLKDIARKTVR